MPISEVDPVDVFNAPISEDPVMIDFRAAGAFRTNSVYGSYNLAAGMNLLEAFSAIRDLGYHDEVANKFKTVFLLDIPAELQSSMPSSSYRAVKGGVAAMQAQYPYLVCIGDEHVVEEEAILHDMSGSRTVQLLRSGRPSTRSTCPLYPTQISPRLFLGSKSNATTDLGIFTDLGITHCLNVTHLEPCPWRESGVRYLQLKVEDDEEQEMLPALREGVHFITAALGDEDDGVPRQRVLVHCSAGRNRSAAMVVAYLLHTRGPWEAIDGGNVAADDNGTAAVASAVEYVRERRGKVLSGVLSNANFVRELGRYHDAHVAGMRR